MLNHYKLRPSQKPILNLEKLDPDEKRILNHYRLCLRQKQPGAYGIKVLQLTFRQFCRLVNWFRQFCVA